MIRVILRGWADVTGEGAFIGDFHPHELDPLVEQLTDIPIYDLRGGGEYQRVARDVDGGPLQWVITDERQPRALLEVLIESAED